MSAVYPPTTATNLLINTLCTSKIVYLPAISTIGAGKVYYIKDICGNAGRSSIFLSTTGLDTIDNSFRPSTLYALMSTNFQSVLLASDGMLNWMVLQNYNANVVTRYTALYPSNPFIYLTPTQTFPSYTTSSAPTFGANFITFPGSSQFLDFGSQALTIGTTGFSAKIKIQWTAFNNWARVFDFNSGTNGVTDMFMAFPGTSSNPLRFQYKESGAEQQTDYASNFALNTIYNITVTYNPAVGSVGATTIWVNGVNVRSNTSMSFKATNKTQTFTYIGKSSYADGYLGAYIYRMGFYQRCLTDAEAAFLW